MTVAFQPEAEIGETGLAVGLVGRSLRADDLRQSSQCSTCHAAAALGYAVMGAGAGGLSLLLFPHSFIYDAGFRMANLLLTPLLAGLVMVLTGLWRRRRDQELVRLDRFGYGFLFALCMAIVRYRFTV